MRMSSPSFAFSLLLFLFATIVLLEQMWAMHSTGIGCAYLFQLWIFYAAGACLHALPWSGLLNNDIVFSGFRLSAYGAAAFASGWYLRPLLFPIHAPGAVRQDASLAKLYLGCGVISFFALQPLLSRVPSISSLALAAGQLTLAGLCLGAFLAWNQNGWPAMLKWGIASLLLPLATVFRLGFLGYGIIALSVIAIFCATFARPRWLVATGFFVAAYAGLCLFVGYMQTRTEIRAAVWGGESFAARASRIATAVRRVKAFDLHSQSDLEAFDSRMNQSYFAGLAAERLSESGDYAQGATLTAAALALVPRLFWPDKPLMGGSGDLVSRFTGLTFARGTSVGVGPVLELYLNFGTPSVVVGFLVLGLLLSYADESAAQFLYTGDWQRFTIWFLFALSFLQVSGSFVEVISSAAASLVTVQIVNATLAGRARTSKIAPLRPGGLQSV
jgi:ABC-type multidrug transport system fused ATPase/permease subunit